MNTNPSPAKERWLSQYEAIETLQATIVEALDDESEAFIERLNDLIMQQDRKIRALPFDLLSAEDVHELTDQINKLEADHLSLREMVSSKKQSLFDLSQKIKHSGRSIKAYQRTQDY